MQNIADKILLVHMPSFVDAILKATLVPLYESSVRRKKNKRLLRREKWHREGRAAWDARLPPVRLQEQGFADLRHKGPVSDQQQSIFFAKLPLEIRRLVYTYAIGGEQLQLETGNDEAASSQPFRLSCLAAQKMLAFPQSCKLA
jgi:hypothetical protein